MMSIQVTTGNSLLHVGAMPLIKPQRTTTDQNPCYGACSISRASAMSTDTKKKLKQASPIRRCWDYMTAVLCCNKLRSSDDITNNLSTDCANIRDDISVTEDDICVTEDDICVTEDDISVTDSSVTEDDSSVTEYVTVLLYP